MPQGGWNYGNPDSSGDQRKRRYHVRRFLSDAGNEASCVTRGKNIIAYPCQYPAWAVYNECFARERLQRELGVVAASEGMAARQSGDHRFLHQCMECDA